LTNGVASYFFLWLLLRITCLTLKLLLLLEEKVMMMMKVFES
jgi:hypothetical protein